MDRDDLNALHGRFDRLETKIDSHLDRLSAAEADIAWLKGFTRLALTLGVTAVGFLVKLAWPSLNK